MNDLKRLVWRIPILLCTHHRRRVMPPTTCSNRITTTTQKCVTHTSCTKKKYGYLFGFANKVVVYYYFDYCQMDNMTLPLQRICAVQIRRRPVVCSSVWWTDTAIPNMDYSVWLCPCLFEMLNRLDKGVEAT